MPEKSEFTLEKLEIHKRLETLETKIDIFLTDNKAFREGMSADMKDIRHIVVGGSATIGLMERVRGIEGVFKHIYLIWIAVVGGIVDFIFRHLTGK